MKHPQINLYGYSDIGVIRPNNEDVWIAIPENGMFAIADGMGGHRAGEIAAKEAILSLCNNARNNLYPHRNKRIGKSKITHFLSQAILSANAHVYDMSNNNINYRGMGTTLCCLYIHKKHAIFAHVGDSRIYLYSKNKLKQLTKDHSLINKLKVINNKKNIRNIITQAIGPTPYVQPDIDNITTCHNDIFILCTDGLSDYIDNTQLEKILQNGNSIDKNTHLLIDTAKKNGSRDNITILMLEVKHMM
jgi:PPM family protein phosphatase